MSGALPYRLIATDLDGTLLRSDETVSPRTRASIEAACARGAAHIVVTGRAVAWTRHILDGLGYEGLAVCGQGAQVYHAGEDRLLTSVTLDRRLAADAVAKLEAEVGEVAVAASADGLAGEVLFGPGFRAVAREDLPVRRVAERAELWAQPIGKLYLQHPDLDDDALTAAARDTVGGLVEVVLAGADTVEVLPLGLSKATGLSVAARRLGVRGAETIAFGDMPNDIPMFRWAGHGVAMAGAHPELAAVADETTGSNDEDGIATVLDRVFG
ncbi:HAD family hydrolase [Streptomyces aculeolatus]